MQRVLNASTIEELRVLAKGRVPKMFYDYVDSGSWSEATYRANELDFKSISFRQRVLRNLSDRSTMSTMLGSEVVMPVALAPVGLCGMNWANGEILSAQAAESFGVPFTLSTMSICSIETVAEATTKPFWFQLYVMKDRDFMKRLISRAKRAGCSALILTLDLQLLGQRHKDKKNGLSAPPKLNSFKNIFNLACHPQWCLNMLTAKSHTFGNIVGHVSGVSNPSSLMAWIGEQFDLTLSWKDVYEIKELWGGKLVLKGIGDVEDALMAADSGLADAIVVSNHGGRQLDGAVSSISLLPQIVKAIRSSSNSDIEIWMDGGIKSGQDVLKAIALGAKGVMIGRSYVYGLGAGGRPGVDRALHIIHEELDKTMALCGHRNIRDVTCDILTNDSY